MPIKWRATGEPELSVQAGMVRLSQTVEVYETAAPETVLATVPVSAELNAEKVAGNPTAGLRHLVDDLWQPKAEAACQDAKRNLTAQGYESAIADRIATLQGAQEGV